MLRICNYVVIAITVGLVSVGYCLLGIRYMLCRWDVSSSEYQLFLTWQAFSNNCKSEWGQNDLLFLKANCFILLLKTFLILKKMRELMKWPYFWLCELQFIHKESCYQSNDLSTASASTRKFLVVQIHLTFTFALMSPLRLRRKQHKPLEFKKQKNKKHKTHTTLLSLKFAKQINTLFFASTT